MTTVHRAESDRGHAGERFRREIITPEGVPLPVYLAQRGERAAAVIIDLIIILGTIFVLSLLAVLGLRGRPDSSWLLAFTLLISFVVRSFYFIFFELRWQGTTPGKRLLGLRVIDRAGGRLRADAVFARNLMREVEIFIPISLLATADHIGTESWVVLLSLIWASVFVLLPFFNKDCLRAGDIVGGTWVIIVPKKTLLPDLAGADESTAQVLPPPELRFTREQLEAYGIYELQTLEQVLREEGPNAAATQDEVCKRIQRKISWVETAEPVDPRQFLEAFYNSLRSHLETRILFGKRREDKHDRQ